MNPDLIFPDVEQRLIDWGALQLSEFDPEITDHLTTTNKLCAVIVRDDSGPDDLVTAARRVAFRVIGTDRDTTSLLARVLAQRLRNAAFTTDWIAAVGAIRGPFKSPPTNPADFEYYLTAELIVLGETPQEKD